MAAPEDRRKKPLVSVEWQREVDVSTGEYETRMFVKMYFDALHSGLLAEIPDREWKTLCALACYMNQEGFCHPSQATLAKKLGVTRQTMNERINALRAFRFDGKPVVTVEKRRESTERGGRWAKNVYFIQPIAGLGIFDQDEKSPENKGEKPMSGNPDTGPVSAPMSGSPDTGTPDTNKNHVTTRKNYTRQSRGVDSLKTGPAGTLVAYFHSQSHHDPSQEPLEKEFVQAAKLLKNHGEARAREVVDFALSKAAETNFRPDHFGGVLKYESQAIASFASREEADRLRQERAQKDAEAERARREEYENLSPLQRAQKSLNRQVHVAVALKRAQPTALESLREKVAEEYDVPLHELQLNPPGDQLSA